MSCRLWCQFPNSVFQICSIDSSNLFDAIIQKAWSNRSRSSRTFREISTTRLSSDLGDSSVGRLSRTGSTSIYTASRSRRGNQSQFVPTRSRWKILPRQPSIHPRDGGFLHAYWKTALSSWTVSVVDVDIRLDR